jgi:hypothetical protein
LPLNGLLKNAVSSALCGIFKGWSVVSCMWSVAFQNTTDDVVSFPVNCTNELLSPFVLSAIEAQTDILGFSFKTEPHSSAKSPHKFVHRWDFLSISLAKYQQLKIHNPME